MCDKCDELDAMIEHYRKLLTGDSSPLALEAIADRIEELKVKILSSRRER
jgi:hypothetical protein